MGRCQSVIVATAVLLLAGCQCQPTDYGATCVMGRSDGGVLLYGDIAPGTDVIALNAVECVEQVCLRQADAGLGAAGNPVQGYCSGQCPATGSCPGSRDGLAGTCAELNTGSTVPGVPAGARYCVYPLSP